MNEFSESFSDSISDTFQFDDILEYQGFSEKDLLFEWYKIEQPCQMNDHLRELVGRYVFWNEESTFTSKDVVVFLSKTFINEAYDSLIRFNKYDKVDVSEEFANSLKYHVCNDFIYRLNILMNDKGYIYNKCKSDKRTHERVLNEETWFTMFKYHSNIIIYLKKTVDVIFK